MEIGAGYEASVVWCSTLCQVELEVTQDAVRTVASLAMKKKTGARGLRSILVSSVILVCTSSTCSLANHNFMH